jgi:peroxiredoxin/predicted 2-oxoglutarate/Fe(II)-dependent dioxygenase YbiX
MADPGMTAPLQIDATTFLTPGDPAPSFIQRSVANPRYAFASAAGRYLVLCFFGSAADNHAQAALKAAYGRPDIFNDDRACFFGVSIDPEDEANGRVKNRMPGYRHFWDFDLLASRLYGVATRDASHATGPVKLARQWVVIDPTMRVLAAIPFRQDRGDLDEVMALLDSLPPPERFAGVEIMAPVLFLPRVFEPELCQHLIGLYEAQGGEESGFMREIGGKTMGITDPDFKRRKDYNIDDRDLISALQARFLRRVVPEIAKVHQFKATRMERYIVSCYAAEDGGHFSAHRDNTTKGTAHRRFAVSVNLNDDFEGGEVSFPEYGPRSFKAPPGGAVVFSCSLLHKVSKVTNGRRFAFLPFLYDDAAARLREENARYIGETGSTYRASDQTSAEQSA